MKRACLVLKVDPSVYANALAAAQPTLTAGGFQADVAASAGTLYFGTEDCVAFARKVARPSWRLPA